MTEQKYCVLYCRVSSRDQKERGSSLEVQKDLGERYAEKYGFQIVKQWSLDEPATKKGRKGFNEMLEYVTRNDIKHILIENQDRASRNKIDEARIDEMVEEGFVFHWFGSEQIYAKDTDEIEKVMQEFKGVLGRYEIAQMKKRTQRSIKKMLDEGMYPGTPPTGYRNIPKTKLHPRQIVKTDDATKVKKFLEAFSSGKYLVTQMEQVAEKMGLKSRHGNPLRLPSIKYMLQNSFYYGEWEYTFKGKVYKGKANGLWEPLVDKKVIERNRKLIEESVVKYQKLGSRDYKFKSLIICSKCGRKLLGEPSKRPPFKLKDGTVKTYPKIYYHCNRSPYKDKETGERKKCNTKWLPEDWVEKQFDMNISLIEYNQEVWDEMKKDLFELQTKEVLDIELASLRAEQTRNESIITRLYADVEDGKITEKIFEKRRSGYEARQDELEEKIEVLEDEQKNWKTTVGKTIQIIDSLKSFGKKYKKADDKTRRMMVRLMTKKVIANYYEGSAPVPKKASYDLNFVWTDEIEELFETGVLKWIDKETDKWNKEQKEKYALPKGKKNNFSSKLQKLDFLFSIS